MRLLGLHEIWGLTYQSTNLRLAYVPSERFSHVCVRIAGLPIYSNRQNDVFHVSAGTMIFTSSPKPAFPKDLRRPPGDFKDYS
jgi:hypothetical protein